MVAYKGHSIKQKSNQKNSISRKVRGVGFYESCGNVFKDMGIPDEEANNLLLRSSLMTEIEKTIEKTGWTQVHTAKLIGVAQPRIAELFAGRIDLFTIDTLIKYLNKLGKKVTLKIHDSEVA